MSDNTELSLKINELRKLIKEIHPLVHCITNPISINQCVNTILAAGARPMCAEHPAEAAVITSSAGAVMLNIGNISDVRMKSIRISAMEAKRLGLRSVLDICGSACLKNRRDYAESLIKDSIPAVVKGNYSEIKSLYDKDYYSSGVDSDVLLETSEMEYIAKKLALRYKTTILASGKTDIVTDGKTIYRIENGSPQLGRITGTGCMQGALCAAFLTVSEGIDAGLSACVMMGVCGEMSETDKGNGTFQVNLLDNLSTIRDEDITSRCRAEAVSVTE